MPCARFKTGNSNDRPSSQVSRAKGTRRESCCCPAPSPGSSFTPPSSLALRSDPILASAQESHCLGLTEGLRDLKSQFSLAVPPPPDRCPTRNPPPRSTFLPASFTAPNPLLAVPEASFPRTLARPQDRVCRFPSQPQDGHSHGRISTRVQLPAPRLRAARPARPSQPSRGTSPPASAPPPRGVQGSGRRPIAASRAAAAAPGPLTARRRRSPQVSGAGPGLRARAGGGGRVPAVTG